MRRVLPAKQHGNWQLAVVLAVVLGLASVAGAQRPVPGGQDVLIGPGAERSVRDLPEAGL